MLATNALFLCLHPPCRDWLFKARLSQSWISGNFNCYLFTVKGGFLTRLKFKEEKFVIYNPTGSQFCGEPSFSGA